MTLHAGERHRHRARVRWGRPGRSLRTSSSTCSSRRGTTGGGGSTARPTPVAGARRSRRSAMTLKLMTYAPDRRARRGADLRAARAGRRRAQLGLPLHLDPRRLVLGLRAARPRLHRRGRGIRRVARRPHRRERRRRVGAARRSCTASTDRPTWSRRRSTTSRATGARARCGSATAPPTSSSSTSTARPWTRSTSPTRTGSRSRTIGWTQVRNMLDWVCDNWDRPEEGIWETRGGRQPFTYGRFMCWVALDRAIRLARSHGRPASLAALDRRSATRSTSRSWRRAGTTGARRSSSTTTPTCSTRRCS